MATKTIKAWINGTIQYIEVEDIVYPEQPISVEKRVDTLEGKHEVVFTDGNLLVGNGTVDLEEMTPEDVLSHINGASVVTLTTAEYEALGDNVNANTLYIPTDSDNVDVYVQNDEPTEVQEGALWLDVDAEGDNEPQIYIDDSLSVSGQAADAKTVGDALATKQPVGNYATETYVTTKIAEAELSGTDVDLSGYATKDEIPTSISELTNDSGFITDYTETDPTVPAWAKQESKPTYDKSEVGLSNVDNVRQYSAENPPIVAQPEAPSDTSLLWLDTDDETQESTVYADWNAAEGEPGHVLNRTHYKEVFEDALIVSETELIYDEGEGCAIVEHSFIPTVGQNYSVVWDGVVFLCTCVTPDEEVNILGNLGLLEAGQDTGEPFCMAFSQDNIIMCIGTDTANHTLSIIGDYITVKKLDTDFLDKEWAREAVSEDIENAKLECRTYTNSKTDIPIVDLTSIISEITIGEPVNLTIDTDIFDKLFFGMSWIRYRVAGRSQDEMALVCPVRNESLPVGSITFFSYDTTNVAGVRVIMFNIRILNSTVIRLESSYITGVTSL